MYKYRIPNEFNQSDKIGKLAMPQAVVLAIGVTIFVLCVITLDLVLSLIAAIPIGFITLVFMFVKINRIPIYEFLMIYLLFMGTPKLLIYRSDNLKSLEEHEDEIGFIEYKQSTKKPVNKNMTKKVVEKNQKTQPPKNSRKVVERQKQPIKKKGVKR